MDPIAGRTRGDLTGQETAERRRAVTGNHEMEIVVAGYGRVRRANQVDGPFVRDQLAEETHHDRLPRHTQNGPHRVCVLRFGGRTDPVVDHLHPVTETLVGQPGRHRLADRHDGRRIGPEPLGEPPPPPTRRQHLADVPDDRQPEGTRGRRAAKMGQTVDVDHVGPEFIEPAGQHPGTHVGHGITQTTGNLTPQGLSSPLDQPARSDRYGGHRHRGGLELVAECPPARRDDRDLVLPCRESGGEQRQRPFGPGRRRGGCEVGKERDSHHIPFRSNHRERTIRVHSGRP